jgi:hypothetical protein
MNFGGEIPPRCRNPWRLERARQGHGVGPRPRTVRLPVNEVADRPVSGSFRPLTRYTCRWLTGAYAQPLTGAGTSETRIACTTASGPTSDLKDADDPDHGGAVEHRRHTTDGKGLPYGRAGGDRARALDRAGAHGLGRDRPRLRARGRAPGRACARAPAPRPAAVGRGRPARSADDAPAHGARHARRDRTAGRIERSVVMTEAVDV